MNLLEGVFSGLVDGCWEVTSPSPLLCKSVCVCVCVCLCMCVARLLLPALLPPSFAVQFSGPFSGSVVQIQGFASGRSGLGPPLTRAHPYSHSRAGNAHAQSLSAGAPRFRGIPSTFLLGISSKKQEGGRRQPWQGWLVLRGPQAYTQAGTSLEWRAGPGLWTQNRPARLGPNSYL